MFLRVPPTKNLLQIGAKRQFLKVCKNARLRAPVYFIFYIFSENEIKEIISHFFSRIAGLPNTKLCSLPYHTVSKQKDVLKQGEVKNLC